MEILTQIQNELKVPKGNYNSFGKYKFRSCEDILTNVKPILSKYDAVLTITDELAVFSDRLFNKATAKLILGEKEYISNGFAEITEHKGMSAEQCNGTASSYSRKYALNGLFLIDETEQDVDSFNKKELDNKNQPKQIKKDITVENFKKLLSYTDVLVLEKAKLGYNLTSEQVVTLEEKIKTLKDAR